MDFIKTRDDDETANLIWNDSAVQHEKIAELRNYQVYCIGAMSSQHTLYCSLEVRKWGLSMKLSSPVAALNRKIWILAFTICSTKVSQWPVAKEHDTNTLLVDVT